MGENPTKKKSAAIPRGHRVVTKHLHGLPKKHSLDIEWIGNELWNQFDIEVGTSTLQRYLSPNDDLKLPADLVIPICRICNDDFSVCNYINKYRKIELNISTVARLTKEAGEAISELASALEDGKITREERNRCITELMDLKELVSQLLGELINK